MSQLVHGLAFGIPKFYIAPYDKISHRLANMSEIGPYCMMITKILFRIDESVEETYQRNKNSSFIL